MPPRSPSVAAAMEAAKKLVKKLGKAFSRKNHSFVLCVHEKSKAQRFDRFLHGFRGVYFQRPHGIKPKCTYQGFSRPTTQAVDVIGALIRLMQLVEQAGYCFNGKLTMKNLYWLSETKAIKVWGLGTRDIVKMTESGIKADFKWIEELIRNNLFAGSKVPRELKYLLGYMTSDPIKYGNLIRHNICLLDEESKIGKFIILYQKLTIIRKLDHHIFQTALSYIKCGLCYRNHDWQAEVVLNDVLQKIFNYHPGGYYSSDEAGVALFGRHCSHHGTDHCIECQRRVIEYSNADIYPMLECHVPGCLLNFKRPYLKSLRSNIPINFRNCATDAQEVVSQNTEYT